MSSKFARQVTDGIFAAIEASNTNYNFKIQTTHRTVQVSAYCTDKEGYRESKTRCIWASDDVSALYAYQAGYAAASFAIKDLAKYGVSFHIPADAQNYFIEVA